MGLKKQQIIIGILLLFILNSCGNYVYKQTTIKPTLFRQKGNFEISLNGAQYGELHGAVAITDYLCISATTAGLANSKDTSFSSDSLGNPFSRTITRRSYNDNEIAIGLYKFNGKSSTTEVYFGMAFSKNKMNTKYSEFNQPNNNYDANENHLLYQRFFIQPAYGFTGKYVDLSIANRLNWIRYNDAKKQTDLISELSFMVRFGFEKVKFMGQMGFTFFNIEKQPYDYLPVNFGVGVYFLMNQ